MKLALGEAIRRLQADHEILLSHVVGRTGEQLAASRPLGDGCDSLHDLIGHVLMWDEINLAVLTEALAGREHWSLDPRWEAPGTGRLLNRGGVAAARHLPADLLMHRLQAVRDAVLDELGRCTPGTWDEVGALAQRIWAVPGQPEFWHAAVHLNQLPDPEGAASW